MKKWYNIDQITRYLVSSVVRYDGYPVYVTSIDFAYDEAYKISFTDLLTGEGDVKVSTSPRWNFDPVPLGFVNMSNFGQQDYALTAMRKPLRAWKTGVSTKTLVVESVSYDIPHPRMAKGYLTSRALARCVIGDYPSYEKATAKLAPRRGNETVSMIAFSRRFAVDTNSKLYHHLHFGPVGTWKDDIDLDENYKFLHETLAEDMRHEAV
jgi:hypothetical protein